MSFYEHLGISENASAREIKKAYMKAARQYHPDKVKGEYPEEMKAKFLKVQRAYEILSDPKKRELYDKFGESAFENDGGMGNSANFSDIFEHFFGGAGGPGGGPGGHGSFFQNIFGQAFGGQRSTTVHKITITLEQAFHGLTKNLVIKSKKKCNVCQAQGCLNPSVDRQRCTVCGGSGVRTVRRQINPMIIQQTQIPCNACNQKGYVIAIEKECKNCNGSCLVEVGQKIQVVIPPGVQNHHKYSFEGMGNDSLEGFPPGNIQVVVLVKEHPIFKRANQNDLYVEKEILLHQALCGFELSLPYLDGNLMKIPIHDVVHPDSVRVVPKAGMPSANSARGNLLIKFNIKFPKTLSAEKKQIIYKALTA